MIEQIPSEWGSQLNGNMKPAIAPVPPQSQGILGLFFWP